MLITGEAGLEDENDMGTLYFSVNFSVDLKIQKKKSSVNFRNAFLKTISSVQFSHSVVSDSL